MTTIRFILLAIAEAGFFLLAFVALCAAAADCLDGIPGFQSEAVVAAFAAASGVAVDLVLRELRRQYRAQVWQRRSGEGLTASDEAWLRQQWNTGGRP